MARLWSCGFELQSVTAGVEVDTIVGQASISTTLVNGGGASLHTKGTVGTAYVTQQFTTTSATNNVYVRFYINFGAFPSANTITIALIRSAAAGNNLTIRCNTAGTIYLNNEQTSTQVGSTSSALSLNTWYRIEYSYVYSTGVANAYINGVNFATGTASASVATDTAWFGNIDANTAITLNYDDIAINDQTGSNQTGLPGAGLLLRYSPNAAGDSNTFGTQVGGTAGSANNFTRVDEVTPDNATSYNASITAASDLFKVGAVTGSLPAGSTINVVQVGGRIANITAADTTASLQFQIEQQASGTIAKSGAIIPDTLTWSTNSTSAPHNSPLTLYQDPTSTNWTTSTIASMQIGYLIDFAHTDASAISTIWAYVDYSPAPIGKDIGNLNNSLGANISQAVNRSGTY